MQWFSALVTVDRECTREDGDLVGRLAAFHAVVTSWPDGRLSVRLSVRGESMSDAAARALGVVEQAADAQPVALELLTETEFYAREGLNEPPTA